LNNVKNAQLERESVFTDLEHEIKEKSEKEQQASRLSTLLRSIIDAHRILFITVMKKVNSPVVTALLSK